MPVMDGIEALRAIKAFLESTEEVENPDNFRSPFFEDQND
jgi:CheY-like chemotaxis protein